MRCSMHPVEGTVHPMPSGMVETRLEMRPTDVSGVVP
jgi:hypothetical protein